MKKIVISFIFQGFVCPLSFVIFPFFVFISFIFLKEQKKNMQFWEYKKTMAFAYVNLVNLFCFNM